MNNDMFSKIDFQEIAGKLWASKWKILCFQFAVALAVASVILFWPRSYRSEARIFLQLGRETVGIDPTATTGQTIAVQQSSREDEIASTMDVLQGRGLIGQVVKDLTPDVVLGIAEVSSSEAPTFTDKVKGVLGAAVEVVRQIDPTSPFERAVYSIEKDLKVRAERKSEVVVIEFEAETPQLAQQVVHSVVQTYKEEHARLHRTEGSQTFFDGQQERLQEELEQANQALKDAKNRMGLASIQGQREILESRTREISQNFSETERSLFEVEAKMKKLQNDLSDIPQRIASAKVEKPNSATDMQAQQLYTLQLTEVEYKSKYAADHPKLVTIRSQVQEAERKHKQQSTNQSEVTNDVNPIHRELSLELLKADAMRSGLLKKLDTLAKQRDDVKQEVREINGFDKDVSDLEREMRIKEKKYIAYTESLEQARINKALEMDKISSVSIVQEATLQERPVSPSKGLVLLFGIMAASAGGLGLGLLSVKLDDRMTTPDSVRNRLGLPIMVTIPKSRVFARARINR